ncbi:MAG: DUF6515 family protein [Ignavibacteriaceae bacterium]
MKNKIFGFNYLNKTVFLAGIIIFSFLFLVETNAQVRREHPRNERRRAVRVEHLPTHYESIVVNRKNYFYHNGSFFRRGQKGYVIIGAPVGARVRALPLGYVIVNFGGLSYYYLNGAYYNYIPSENVYVVVNKPGNAPGLPSRNLDQVKLYDGSIIEGIFQSGTDSTISIKVNNEIREIPINNIISISFAQSIPGSD